MSQGRAFPAGSRFLLGRQALLILDGCLWMLAGAAVVWLGSDANGAKAVSKDVYQESDGGKWVRYDANGQMIKGWNTNENGTYYFDLITGAMAHGTVEINGKTCHFDEATGILK